MLGVSGYDRSPLDFYVTPKRAVESLLTVIGDDLPMWQVWEPFCGNGAISNVINPLARDMVTTDIRAYEGFDPDGLFDFFKLLPMAEHRTWCEKFEADPSETNEKAFNGVSTMADIFALKGFAPDAIITNPPYGKDAERAARHAIALMEEQKGIVIFLCRHEWDAAKGRADLFDHPAFAMKIVLRHRPRWIADSKGAPRFPYSWFVWNWQKPVSQRPELLYAA